MRGEIPVDGLYRVSSTWREVVDAALSVGRDPSPWLASVPALAWSEIIVRYSPLVAYLGRQPCTGGTGFRVEPNVIYRDGTERSARGAFGYRIGMTMAEWACRGLMGLGPTIHAEAVVPVDAGPAWSPFGSLPDLVGKHSADPRTWLIEAKGHRRLMRAKLLEGASQLSRPGLLTSSHLRVLCGTSLEPRLFMTIDIEEHVGEHRPKVRRGGRREPANDDTALLALARSRMLQYLALTAISPAERQIVPVGLAVGRANRFGSGMVTPLESDPTTGAERSAAARDSDGYERRDGRERRDMLTGRIPGTDLIIGMSRRLFAACRELAAVQQLAAVETDRQQPFPDPEELDKRNAEGLDTYDEQRRAQYWRYAHALVRDASARTRRGFEYGARSTWYTLLDRPTPFRLTVPSGLLEAATADTYLALDTRTIR